MYIKKEITKTIISAIVGIILVALFAFSDVSAYTGNERLVLMLISPLYGIGIVYGWNSIWGLLKKTLGLTATGSFFSALFKSFTSFLITLTLSIIAIACIIMFAWIIGLGFCIRDYSRAASNDKSVR